MFLSSQAGTCGRLISDEELESVKDYNDSEFRDWLFMLNSK